MSSAESFCYAAACFAFPHSLLKVARIKRYYYFQLLQFTTSQISRYSACRCVTSHHYCDETFNNNARPWWGWYQKIRPTVHLSAFANQNVLRMNLPPPQKKIQKIFFSGKYHVKFEHFVNLSDMYFRAKMFCPPGFDHVTRLPVLLAGWDMGRTSRISCLWWFLAMLNDQYL